MLTTDRQEAVAQLVNTLQRPNRWASPKTGTAAWTDPIASGTAPCPDDCHYCSGPETD